MPRIQKQFAYRYEAKDGPRAHYKHVITVPEKLIDELGWKPGSEIHYQIQRGKLVISESRGKE